MTKPITVLYTAAGAPQAATLVRHIKNNGEHPVRMVGLDMNTEVIGRYLSDGFHRIPQAGGPGYREAVLRAVEAEKADAILNCSGADVWHIASLRPEIEALGCKVVASSPEAIALADNKYKLYQTFKDVAEVPVPAFGHPRSLDEFVTMARAMGYPERDICFKPHVSKGSRGFRILTERFDRRDLLMNHKPTARYMSLGEFIEIFKGHADFPDLMLMEVVEGEEVDAMTIALDGQALLTTLKSRESHRWGIIDRGRHIDRPDIERSVAAIVARIPLAYNISIQFIDGKLIEINPRTSTFVFQPDMNEPWLAIKLALGLITPDEVRAHRAKVRMGRGMIRYMDQIFFDQDSADWTP